MSRATALLGRAALLPWLIPTLIVGVALGVAMGIAGRSLVGVDEPELPTAAEKSAESEAAPVPGASVPVGPSANAPADAGAETAPGAETRFLLTAARGGGSRATVQLRGVADDFAGLTPGEVAYCQVERSPPWRLGEMEQPRKRRDDCWLDRVTYEDVDVEPGERYSYEVRLHDASGRLLATSDIASIEIDG